LLLRGIRMRWSWRSSSAEAASRHGWRRRRRSEAVLHRDLSGLEANRHVLLRLSSEAGWENRRDRWARKVLGPPGRYLDHVGVRIIRVIAALAATA
jgi:hypothetical protein